MYRSQQQMNNTLSNTTYTLQNTTLTMAYTLLTPADFPCGVITAKKEEEELHETGQPSYMGLMS